MISVDMIRHSIKSNVTDIYEYNFGAKVNISLKMLEKSLYF